MKRTLHLTIGACAPSAGETAGEDYYPSHEALHEIICLLDEHDALNGGGPGWRARWDKARGLATQLVGRDEP